MAFFIQHAIADGTIDQKIGMSEKEFEMMILGRIQDSQAWHRHMMKHKDAKIVPTIQEESEFENKIKGKRLQQPVDPEIINYDANTKHFTAGCQCGETFQFDVKSDKVSEFNPMSKMKDMEEGGYSKETAQRRSGNQLSPYTNPSGKSSNSANSAYGFVNHSKPTTYGRGGDDESKYGR